MKVELEVEMEVKLKLGPVESLTNFLFDEFFDKWPVSIQRVVLVFWFVVD